MISIINKQKCSGCKACANACPVDAISFELDREGFWYPIVNSEKCINCGKCEKVCPYNKKEHGIPAVNNEYEAIFFAAQLKKQSELKTVSSGGAFQAVAETVLNKNGIIYGAIQENVDHIYHIRVSDFEKLKLTRRSKYLHSDIGSCYRFAEQDLKSGRIVLFSGTGCQIAGLNCYLDKRYNNLYTCEVVCHGVPSQTIWEKYRHEKESAEGKHIIDLIFRDKSKGWSQNQYKIVYENGKIEYERSTVQLFHAGYLNGFFYRPSCGSCPFASMPRVADITLADYWKYKGSMMIGDMGVSLVAVNNDHGLELLNMSEQLLNLEGTLREYALDSCKHMDENPTANPLRESFINMALKDGYFMAARKYIVAGFPLKVRMKKIIRKIFRRVSKWR